MKNETLQNYKSDIAIIEKEVSLHNTLNPNEYIVEFNANGLTAQVLTVNSLEQGFFVFDSIRNSIKYEIAQYENKL